MACSGKGLKRQGRKLGLEVRKREGKSAGGQEGKQLRKSPLLKVQSNKNRGRKKRVGPGRGDMRTTQPEKKKKKRVSVNKQQQDSGTFLRSHHCLWSVKIINICC